MSTLTREQIEAWRRGEFELIPRTQMEALCDIALRSLEQNAAGQECPECHGYGDVKRMTQQHGPDDYEVDVECPTCKGTGVAPAAPHSEPQVPGRSPVASQVSDSRPARSDLDALVERLRVAVSNRHLSLSAASAIDALREELKEARGCQLDTTLALVRAGIASFGRNADGVRLLAAKAASAIVALRQELDAAMKAKP